MNDDTPQILHKPLIGITADAEDEGGYSKFPWYALRRNYASAIARAGGVPIILPHEQDLTSEILGAVSGLVVTGGFFDVDPALYGGGSPHETIKLKEDRTQFEMSITRAALERDMPVLGICGGQQLLAVVLGGTLIQHIPDEVAGALEHEQPNPRDEAGHEVIIADGTLLKKIVGAGRMNVNSAHHQAVKDVSGSMIINARAPDSVIEGIEAPGQRFCLGVQWHPEFEIDPGDVRIFAAFVDAARK
ncbi:MAG: gamma-glutamyl-gamma-aminobutyrate hydrolase family protein [Rhodospirillales bacterium]|nr:gamma-glutamyl-gamma-aminobutyrate hydrolase family protein [Rhodospirillales bacterium]